MALLATLGYLQFKQELNDLFDQHLVDESLVVTNLVKQLENDTINQNLLFSPIQFTTKNLDHLRVAVARESNFTEHGLQEIFASHVGFKVEPSEGFANCFHNNRYWRIYTRFDPEENIWVTIGDRVDDRFERFFSVYINLIGSGFLVLLIVVGMVFFWVKKGLQPVQNLSCHLIKKSVDDLTPIQLTRYPSELKPLVVGVNDLLRRVNQSVIREQAFFADAAHELRTPVTGLKLSLHNHLREITEQTDNAKDLKLGIDRLGHLLEQLLTLNRIIPDPSSKPFSRVNLRTCIESVVEESYPLIKSKQQSIKVDIDDQYIFGDMFSLQALVKNLLVNSIKYTPHQGVIKICLNQINHSQVQLSIEDSGPGVPDEEKSRIFDRFYRVGGDRHASNVMGCGLGLSIVKRIIDIYHARIELVDSFFETGLKVNVTFPISKA